MCIAKVGGLVPLFEEKKVYVSGIGEIPKSPEVCVSLKIKKGLLCMTKKPFSLK
jgi:hypothetical protein